jgi:spore cortex biosynthesis protein YabQ
MSDSIGSQIHVFLYSVAGGILIAFIYDIFRLKRRAVKTAAVFIYLEDIAFWMVVAVIMLAVLYYGNEGEIRGYIFLAVIFGVFIYLLLLSKIVMNVFMFILKIIYRIFSFVINIMVWPIRVILRFLSIPARVIMRFSHTCIKAVGKKSRTLTRIVHGKAVMWKRSIKNIVKKI